MKIYRLGACLKCRGDLALDNGDWLCLQCGVYYYTGLYADAGAGTGALLRICAVDPAAAAASERAAAG